MLYLKETAFANKLRPPGGATLIIGVDLQNNLFFAKFVVDQKVWHGYPVHPRDYDTPPDHVLDGWLRSGVLTKLQRSKISEGKFRK